MGSAHHSLRERPIVFTFGEGRFKSYYILKPKIFSIIFYLLSGKVAELKIKEKSEKRKVKRIKRKSRLKETFLFGAGDRT